MVDGSAGAIGVREQGAELLLQIDTEGYEYETFLGMSDELARRFRIIAAEFHDLDQLWNRPFFRLASRAFDKILQTHSCSMRRTRASFLIRSTATTANVAGWRWQSADIASVNCAHRYWLVPGCARRRRPR